VWPGPEERELDFRRDMSLLKEQLVKLKTEGGRWDEKGGVEIKDGTGASTEKEKEVQLDGVAILWSRTAGGWTPGGGLAKVQSRANKKT